MSLKALAVLTVSLSLISLSSGVIGSDQSAIRNLQLVNQFGEPYSLKSTQDKVALVVFGYTSCPDVCPMGLTIVSSILKKLGDEADKITAMFISVDPIRDTPDVLQSYVSWFHKDILGLTGSTTQIDTAVKAFNAQYSLLRSSDADNSYTVDHSSGFYLVDADGQLAQIVPFGLPAEHTLQAVRKLIALAE